MPRITYPVDGFLQRHLTVGLHKDGVDAGRRGNRRARVGVAVGSLSAQLWACPRVGQKN